MRHRLTAVTVLTVLLIPVLSRAEGIYLGSGLGLGIPTPTIHPLDKKVDQDLGLAYEAISLGYDSRNWGVGLQWGGAGGDAQSYFYGDGSWGIEYLTVSGRYLFVDNGPINPYLELGTGGYTWVMDNDLAEIESEPVWGLRLAAGAKFNLGNFYIATELDYHAADFSDAHINTAYSHADVDLDSRVDMLVFLVKTGLQAHR